MEITAERGGSLFEGVGGAAMRPRILGKDHLPGFSFLALAPRFNGSAANATGEGSEPLISW
jgi:hypothetical protein